MLRRTLYLNETRGALARSPVVAILGPRQCGKTTLARQLLKPGRSHYFDLEDETDLARLDSPKTLLDSLEGLVVIDEIQRKPDLFPLLRVLVDRPKRKTRFLILGSASPHLIRGVSESLAGRVSYVDMSGFDMGETGSRDIGRLWTRGGMPRSFIARGDSQSMAWRMDYIRTFLERDIPQLGITVPAPTLRRFWMMVAHFHGQIWNAAEFARSMGSSEPTARRYLDILTGSYVIRQLEPWYQNVGKRQVKAPKIYIRDSGILHALHAIRSHGDLVQHPKVGASWEGFALEQVLRLWRPDDFYFWATHAGAELDLLLFKNGRRYGVEFKRADAPHLTPSMKIAMKDLGLKRLIVVYPGTQAYRLDKNIDVMPLSDLIRHVI